MRFLRATVFFAAVTVVVAALLWLASVAFESKPEARSPKPEALGDGYPANWTRAQYDIFTACVGTGIIDTKGAVPVPAIVQACRTALRLPTPKRGDQ